MNPVAHRITPDLISDYVAGRLDAREADLIENAMSRNRDIAAAVAAARKLNSRIGRYFSQRSSQGRG